MILPNSKNYTQQEVSYNPDMEEEIEKIEEEEEKEDEEKEEIIFLTKKHYTPDMEDIYSQIFSFIRSDTNAYEKNYNLLGKFKTINSCQEIKKIKIKYPDL